MASNTHSFDLAWFGPNLQQNAYLDAPLRSVTVWADGSDYAAWNLSFTFSTPVNDISYVQVVLRPNERCFRPIPYGSAWDLANPQGLTTVQFRGAENPYSTSTAQPIFTADFTAQCTMRSTINMMTRIIPGYRLRQGNKGSDGWTYYIIHTFVLDGRLSINTMLYFDNAIQAVRNSSRAASRAVSFPPTFGTPIL
ncbi:hypothetical protein NLJ89_g6156 [Agrocybe chaxingu]|uniref:Uncharacterized protein n=1 Tax=Agrocybe chaxingu TaxID=84603 RepID=A0A9W8JZA6_9AGAR|nr:hypothetical protein NLJ89_g6156 [Agrocybe chaxingu]